MANESNQAGRDQRLINPKKKVIQFYLSKEDFEILKKAALFSGLSKAAFVRTSSVEKARQIIQKNKGLSQNAY